MDTGIVYLLGAGVNQSIKTLHREPVISPPMAHNFFKVARRLHIRFRDYDDILEPLYSYISKYWHKSRSDLEDTNFSLEECFTLIQLQLMEARLHNDRQTANGLLKVQYLLIAFFAEVMSEFSLYYQLSPAMLNFGKVLFNEKPMIITFNYDLFIESVIENASGKSASRNSLVKRFQRELTEEELCSIVSSSEWNWNRPLGYGIKFDRVLLHDGSIANRQKLFEKRKFYSNKNNKLYRWSLLKLHGSLNWWRYVNDTPNVYISAEKRQELYELKKKEIVLENLEWFLPVSETPWNEEQLFVEPIIITPVLNKQFYGEKFIYKKVFDRLWKKAKDSLSECKSLIVIGYSFSPTDFYTRKLLMEAFSNNKVDELTIVDPNKKVREEIKKLVQFKKLKEFSNLEKFIRSRVR